MNPTPSGVHSKSTHPATFTASLIRHRTSQPISSQKQRHTQIRTSPDISTFAMVKTISLSSPQAYNDPTAKLIACSYFLPTTAYFQVCQHLLLVNKRLLSLFNAMRHVTLLINLFRICPLQIILLKSCFQALSNTRLLVFSDFHRSLPICQILDY